MTDPIDLSAVLVLLALVAPLSAALTAATIAYAHRRGLLDQPGRRRAHRIATPRGGGVGPVLSWSAAVVLLAGLGAGGWASIGWVLAGVSAVAVIGAVDDHRPLPALPRLLVHVLAGAMVVAGVAGVPATLPAALGAVVAVGFLAALINVWNFMDGVNGIASAQAALIAALLSLAAGLQGATGLSAAAAALALGCVGFLPFNLPVARVFLGDVGSYGLGLAIGALLLAGWVQGLWPLLALVALPSAFLIDAGCTLLLRMAAGRRWYTAHRSHLYQWLARRGWPHSRIALVYLLWTLLSAVCVLPGVLPEAGRWTLGLLLMAVGVALWLGARRRILRHAGMLH